MVSNMEMETIRGAVLYFCFLIGMWIILRSK